MKFYLLLKNGFKRNPKLCKLQRKVFLNLFLLGCFTASMNGQVNLLTNGDMESSSDWFIYDLGSDSSATYEFNYTDDAPSSGNDGCLRITSDYPTDILFWQKFTVKAGEEYTVDAAIKTNYVESFWAEIYVSTIAPIEDTSYLPNNNGDVVAGFSTWYGCGANEDGLFSTDACTGSGSFTVPDTLGDEVTIYFGFKTGSMADTLPNSLEVLIDDLQLLRTTGTGNSITTLSLGAINTSSITIPGNVIASQLESAIEISDYASFYISTSSGDTVGATATVTSSMQVRVTSESGSLNTYSILTSGTIDTEELSDYNDTVSSFQNRIINIDGSSSIVFTNDSTPLQGSALNLMSEDVWLYFPNILPSYFVENHLGNILINGAEALADTNVRVVQYQSGVVVISQPSTYQALTAYSSTNLSGSSINCGNYIYYQSDELGDMENNIESFVLKKGYMATLAENEDGTGASKNYVAAYNDIEIDEMPEDLTNNVSFVRVIPWRWASKKGWCSGKDGASALLCTWHYDWNNATTSSRDIEYIPMRHNASWNSYENINNKENSTHVLGFNEPDRSDQANLSVDSALALWPNLLKSGLRLGSPCPSDGSPSWVFEFLQKADSLKLRVDFVAVHWYKGGQTALQFYNWLKWIYNNTGRPIWITEWNNGANWTCCLPSYEEQATAIEAFITMFDTASFVERYSLYNWVQDERKMFYEYATTYTPAGEVYRDFDAALAFNGSYEDRGIIPGHPYNMIARHSSKPLEVADASTDNNALVIQNSYDGGEHQQWKFQLTSDGYYKVININSSKALDVGETSDGYVCQQWSYWGGENQQWALTDLNNGYYKITSRATGYALTVADASTADSASITVAKYTGATNQQFNLDNLVSLKSTLEEPSYVETVGTVTIYPNPVSETLNIVSEEEITQLSVYTISGKLIWSQRQVENNSLDVSGLKAGMYVLKIKNETSTNVLKFIKDH